MGRQDWVTDKTPVGRPSRFVSVPPSSRRTLYSKWDLASWFGVLAAGAIWLVSLSDLVDALLFDPILLGGLIAVLVADYRFRRRDAEQYRTREPR